MQGFERHLGRLLRGEACPLVAAIARGSVCLFEVALRLRKPVTCPIRHAWSVPERSLAKLSSRCSTWRQGGGPLVAKSAAMPLGVGTRVGVYEVLGSLGAGGMGEVYRARDTRLKREVALKILPASFATNPERLARFQREAEVLASLNHPHIAAIYGLVESLVA
jgi:serine/threonine protein kinase